MVQNVSATEAWRALRDDPQARLIDVRTDAEWAFVGIPDLSETGREIVLIPWQLYPTMQINAGFLDHLRQAGVSSEDKLFFICRSGGRSMAAAQAASRAGFTHTSNVADGFEGDPDAEGHRGTLAGWKAVGLPWRQR